MSMLAIRVQRLFEKQSDENDVIYTTENIIGFRDFLAMKAWEGLLGKRDRNDSGRLSAECELSLWLKTSSALFILSNVPRTK